MRQLDHDVRVTIEATQRLLLKLMDNRDVLRSISWNTVGAIQEIYRENQIILGNLDE